MSCYTRRREHITPLLKQLHRLSSSAASYWLICKALTGSVRSTWRSSDCQLITATGRRRLRPSNVARFVQVSTIDLLLLLDRLSGTTYVILNSPSLRSCLAQNRRAYSDCCFRARHKFIYSLRAYLHALSIFTTGNDLEWRFSVFRSTGWAIHISWSKCCLSVCLSLCLCTCACVWMLTRVAWLVTAAHRIL